MKMPPFWKTLKFWEAACFVMAALVAQFAPEYALDAAKLLAVVVAVFELIGVPLELRARGLLK